MSARQRRKARHVERESAPAQPVQAAQPPTQAPWWRTPAWALACLVALALAGTDIYYRVGILRAGEMSRSGNPQGAVSLYSSIFGFNPRVSEALDGLGFWSLQAGKLDDALQQWSQSLALNPTETSVYAHIGLGEVYLRMGRVDDAIHHLELAKQMRPEEQSSYILLSSAYERRGDHAQAEAIRAQAAKVVPVGAKPARVFY
jgi:Flp pilus assembly protein TadD